MPFELEAAHALDDPLEEIPYATTSDAKYINKHPKIKTDRKGTVINFLINTLFKTCVYKISENYLMI